MATFLPPSFFIFSPPPPRWDWKLPPPPPPRRPSGSGGVIPVVSMFSVLIILFVLVCICAIARRRPPAASVPEPQDNNDNDEQQLRSAAAIDDCCPRRASPITAGLPLLTYTQSLKHNVTGSLPGDEAATCSVCLGTLEVGETVRLLPVCLHLYHVECIDPWLVANSTCPICRSGTMDEGLLPPV